MRPSRVSPASGGLQWLLTGRPPSPVDTRADPPPDVSLAARSSRYTPTERSTDPARTAGRNRSTSAVTPPGRIAKSPAHNDSRSSTVDDALRNDLTQALEFVEELMRHRLGGQKALALGLRLRVRLATSDMSDVGHECYCSSSPLITETLISTREAAAILGLSPRQVLRLKSDLGGELVNRRQTVFRLSAVIEYQKGRVK